MSFVRRLVKKLLQLNLFADAESIRDGNVQTIKDQILSTKFYLILLFSSLLVLILFTSLAQTTKTKTIATPSESEYLKLEFVYPNTLICPCREIAIPYDRLLSIVPTYHQICSSGLISSEWIASLFHRETAYLSPLDIRLSISSQFRLLSEMCNASKLMVEQTRDGMIKEKLVSGHVLSNSSFDVQMDALLNRFFAELDMYITPSQSSKMFTAVLAQSRIHSAIHTDAFTTGVPNINQYSTISSFYPLSDNASLHNNLDSDFGYCDSFHTYTYKGGIYSWSSELRSLESMMTPFPSPVYVIPGMYVGCTPYDAIVAADLQCFFDSICLNSTIPWISTLDTVDWPKILNESIPSRFQTNDTIKTIFAQQMIEKYDIKKNFSKYYSLCNPVQCTYTYTGYNDFIYVITMIISLFGGLITVTRIISPLVVQLIRCIQLYFQNRNQQNQQPRREWRIQIVQLMSSFKIKIISFNLFKDDIDNELVAVRATRIHVMLIGLSLIILTFYSSLTISTRSITMSKPSINQFEYLYSKYSLTLTCPCSRIAISNHEIITVSSPRYHQVCESDFVKPIWLDGYFQMKFENESTKQTVGNSDFRTEGLLLFNNVLFLCDWANKTVSNAKAVFDQDTFVSTEVLSRNEFHARISPVIDTFKERISDYITILVQLTRILVASSGAQSRPKYQSFYVNNSWLIRRYSPGPSNLYDCACSVSFDCPMPTGNFFCVNGNNCTKGFVWRVPGIIQSCVDIDSLFNLDLRCFYNQTCFNEVLSLYNLDMPTRLPLSNDTLSIRILNQSFQSRFHPTATLGTLFNSLMIEEWLIESHFENYFQSCSPTACTYIYNQRLDVFYVIATISGLLGGLLVTFRLIIPVIARCTQLIIDYYRKNDVINSQNEQQNDVISFWSNVKNKLSSINFFKKESSTTIGIDNISEMSIKATRVYLILLTFCVLILLFFNALRETKISNTINNPSLIQFERLYEQYSSSLLCPCANITIPYKTFLSVSTTMHQVCNSQFVTSYWTTTLYGYESSINNSYSQLDRPILSKQHQILSWFCFTSREIIRGAILRFEEKILVSATAMSRDSFQLKVTEALEQLIEQTPDSILRTNSFVTELLQASQLMTVFNTDWLIDIGNSSNDYLLRNIPTTFPNSTCICAVSTSCRRPMRIGPSDLSLPGLVVGCWPLNGLRMSTLECFYSFTCINTILGYLNYFTDIHGSPPNNYTFPRQLPLQIDPLQNLTSSRFPLHTTIDQIMDQLFIEQYFNQSSYESYYDACSPTACRYQYIHRNSFLYVATSILSLYGGLTVSLGFFVWNSFRIHKYIKHSCNIRRTTTVQPFANTN